MNANQKNQKVMVVVQDDYLASAARLALTLDSKIPLDPEIINTGKQALEKLTGGDYSLIVCRPSLPGMPDLEFLRQARQLGCTAPAIVVSKNGDEIAPEDMTELDIHAHVSEPFCAQSFVLDVFKALTANAQEEDMNQNLEELFVVPKKSILIMDDDRNLCRIYAKALGKSNYMVCIANTMDEAREFIATYEFDIFICDIHMGRQRGVDLLQEYQEKFQRDNTYIIMASAYGQYRHMTQEFGADFFLEKPISLDTLLTIVNRLLDYSEDEETTETKPQAKVEAPKTEPSNLITGS